MSELLTIDGINLDVFISKIGMSFNIIDGDAAGRNPATGKMFLDPIGVFYGHTVTATPYNFNYTAFRDLWDILSDPNKVHDVTLPNIHGNMSYKAYCRVGSTEMIRANILTGNHLWTPISFNIIPMEVQRRA